MRILITGGAGYLGSTLVPLLLEAGHRVTVLDDMRYAQHGALAACCAYPSFSFALGDVRDRRVLEPLISSADVVIPLAAMVGAPLCDRSSIEAWSVNVDGIKTLTGIMAPSQFLIIPISNSGYGIGSDEPCDENSPLLPISVYGRSKVAAEEIAMERSYSVSLRLATLFGASPRMRIDLLVNEFVWLAHRYGSITLFQSEFRRNFCHVKDAASAFTHVLNHSTKTRGNVFNVGDDRANMTKRQLCDHIVDHLPNFRVQTSPIGEDPDKRDYLVSNRKFESTGWSPSHTIDDGISELIKLYSMLPRTLYGNF